MPAGRLILGDRHVITIQRSHARRLRELFRRSVLGARSRRPIPMLVLRAEGTKLRAQYRHEALAVEHVEVGEFGPHETLALPLDALADFAAAKESTVALEAATSLSTVACWDDHGIPQTRTYTVPDVATLPALPHPPDYFVAAPPGLLAALKEAVATTDETAVRYAIDCVQLRGKSGQMVATDGRQLLVHRGFRFPWDEDLLVRRTPLFGCPELNRDVPLEIGKTDDHVVIRTGPWTIWLQAQKGRFPEIDRVIPRADATTTRLKLARSDAEFLAKALDRLPGSKDPLSPITLDLNGHVAIRAQGVEDAKPSELVLRQSRFTGKPVRVVLNRRYLARAARMGIREVDIVAANQPMSARHGDRALIWQPIEPEGAIPPADDVVPIESPLPEERAPEEAAWPTARRTERTTETMSTPKPDRALQKTNNGQESAAASNGIGAPTLVTLVQEAEALYSVLDESRTRARHVVKRLRQYRKRSRVAESALQALRQLRLEETAESTA
jgi:hypothetical protein